jgi:phosphoglycolate phosphatase
VNVIIFDFDGTIADSFSAFVEITNRLALEYGFPQISPADLAHLRNLSSKEVLNQSKVSRLRLPFFLRRFRREFNHKVCHLKPIPGMKEALQALKHRGDRLGIVTSNSEENVRGFLQAQGLEDLFDFVGGGLPLFGKERVLRRIIRQRHLNPAQVIYVGDETRDVEAAKKSEIRVVAVGWGFNTSQALARHQPDFLIQHPQELVDCLSPQDRRGA